MNSTLVKGVMIMAAVAVGYLLMATKEAAQVNEQQTIRMAISTTPLSAPIIIAQELDYFTEQNIYVELQPLRGGHLCFEALMKGDADLATSSESVVMFNSFRRSDFRIISSFVESDNDIKLLSLTTSELSTPQQLRGKRIGMVQSSASEFFLYAYLIMTGHADLSIKPVYMAPQDLGPALLAGEVDAISIWEPYGYRLHKAYGEKIASLNSKGSYNLSFNLIANTHNNLSDEQLVSILTALRKASQYIASSPEQAKQLVSDYLNISPKQLDWGWEDYIFRLSLNNSLIANLQTQARWAKAANLVDAKQLPDYRLLIDDKYLTQALLNNRDH
ncbi:ABC transporter substrate-binding protein [Shewanella sp. Scap07]|uniref:ABC transporter substrate-binding protein n=1 Tax=Shewanella sp. Scap07 TaxID=2589987 RepID=UPI0015C101C8|nr:ABC transporter substrate-binding protein [Shewanella sp. Scap07]QLE85727.1 ABC transporter substrate-binding protein [Shewanella sp. Scap07]